jgi:hypothetical protein
MWDRFWHWLFSGVLPEVSEQWDYAMITLIVRFVGVFAVMAAMQVALQASARVVRALEKRQAGKEEPEPVSAPAASVETAASATEEPSLDEATIAAIGLALALESRQPTAAPPTGGPSAWSSASRMRQPPRSPRQ